MIEDEWRKIFPEEADPLDFPFPEDLPYPCYSDAEWEDLYPMYSGLIEED